MPRLQGGVFGKPGRGSIFGEKYYAAAAKKAESYRKAVSKVHKARSRSRSRSVGSNRSRPSVSARKSASRKSASRKSASRASR